MIEPIKVTLFEKISYWYQKGHAFNTPNDVVGLSDTRTILVHITMPIDVPFAIE